MKKSFAEEIGDVLFTLCNLARHRGVDPESALRGSLDAFSARFRWVEKPVQDQGTELTRLSDTERDELWEQAKSALGLRALV